jgi:methylamine dehydrogenase accessory protein MauD
VGEPLLVSNLVLWAIVIALALVVLALARQVGVLHARLGPVGALSLAGGPESGEPAPQVEAESLEGGAITIGGAGRRTLLVFLAPSCPVCRTLLPVLRTLARDPGLRVVLASDGPREEHEAFVREHRLGDLPYILSERLGLAFRVPRLPWAAMIDADGILRSQGLVNSREHLESLLEAEALGVASLQEHLERRASGGGAA